jgi:hypothetical protein
MRIPLTSLMILACLVGGGKALGEPSIDVSPPRPLGKGTAVRLRLESATTTEDDLLIHFHGAVDTIRQAMERAGTTATVIVVNQPGLSGAYAAPFREDADLFARLLAEPGRFDAVDGDDDPPPRWRRVSLSCFSAGYGAVREILKDPTSFDRVDAIVAADSIYAGLDETPLDKAARRVDPRDMAGFLAFARAAADAKKVFVVTHCAQPTPYASTTETADDLLASVGLERSSLVVVADAPFPQVSRAGRGGFAVLGFAGASGPAHLFHLRSIDRWWQVADRLAAAGHEPR